MNKASMIPILGSALLAAIMSGCSGVPPANLGAKEGRLAPCPPSPNCVSSQDADSSHAAAPLTYSISLPRAVADLKKVILGMKRARIVTQSGSYLHAEFTSALWRFVDDVEFLFDDQAKVIHIRSASRLGHSDFGVNRKRVEEIRAAWTAREKEQGH